MVGLASQVEEPLEASRVEIAVQVPVFFVGLNAIQKAIRLLIAQARLLANPIQIDLFAEIRRAVHSVGAL